MTIYTVIATIQSKDRTNPPVDMKHYKGDNLALAISAAASAATLYEKPSKYSHLEPDVLSVRIDFTEDFSIAESDYTKHGAGLGVGHIWTNVDCPAYDSHMSTDCVCTAAIAAIKELRHAHVDEFLIDSPPATKRCPQCHLFRPLDSDGAFKPHGCEDDDEDTTARLLCANKECRVEAWSGTPGDRCPGCGGLSHE